MNDLATSGMCHFSAHYDFEHFKKELKRHLYLSEISNVTVHQYTDGSVIIVHEWAGSDDDLRVSNMVCKKVVEDFGGSYTTN
ncbi:hypothetical protein ACWKSU_07110 [Enterobacter cloacae]|uniref:hypothetical protein n=1 Tax=Enterobacter cloacae TaxID=550 RepID=UPI00228B995B|nr:hypothetical protein [Enterobacter cloacae]ELD6622845.1 hypothetical protein [Enterobacter cloacae]HCT7576745.1 hypothetical protein [Enterobacter cloacae]